MGVMSDLGSSLLGQIEKAILIISDDEVAGVAVNPLASRVNSRARDGLGNNDKLMRVQFNPESLSLYSISSAAKVGDVTGTAAETAVVSANAPEVNLQVKLIFDDFSKSDAFQSERLPTNADGLKSVVKGLLGTYNSVRFQIEGIIAASREDKHCTMTFCWGEFAFKGALMSATATYTMFNTQGEPIRGSVDLRLRQLLKQNELGGWMKDFDNAFGPDLGMFGQYLRG